MNHNEQTTISLPKETKRKVRILAAELGIPMGKTALKLIEAGLDDYRQRIGEKDLSDPAYVMHGTDPVMAEAANG